VGTAGASGAWVRGGGGGRSRKVDVGAGGAPSQRPRGSDDYVVFELYFLQIYYDTTEFSARFIFPFSETSLKFNAPKIFSRRPNFIIPTGPRYQINNGYRRRHGIRLIARSDASRSNSIHWHTVFLAGSKVGKACSFLLC
jgi:hypothetical protein